MTNLAVLDP